MLLITYYLLLITYYLYLLLITYYLLLISYYLLLITYYLLLITYYLLLITYYLLLITALNLAASRTEVNKALSKIQPWQQPAFTELTGDWSQPDSSTETFLGRTQFLIDFRHLKVTSIKTCILLIPSENNRQNMGRYNLLCKAGKALRPCTAL